MSLNEKERKRFKRLVAIVIAVQLVLMVIAGAVLVYVLLDVGF